MPEVAARCAVCRAMLDDEDLFCANCGTETPLKRADALPSTIITTHRFECQGCGASMSYDAGVQRLRCPFCGSEQLESKADGKTLKPSRVVKFDTEQNEALAKLRAFMGGSFWRPSDLQEAAVVTRLTAVYVPYYVFSAKVYTYWTADSSVTPTFANASWYPVSGQREGEYQGVLVGASGVLTPAETAALNPFDLSRGVEFEEVDLENVVYEPFSVQRKYARTQVQAAFDELETQACAALVPGNARNVHVNVRVEGLASEPVLLPIWVMAYQYREQLYRFLVNGQTGRCTGTAPTSMAKVAAVSVGVIVAIIVAVIAFAICSGIASR